MNRRQDNASEMTHMPDNLPPGIRHSAFTT